jgi:hypothetical protein
MGNNEEKCLTNVLKDPITLSISLVTLLLSQKEAGRLIALYVFYLRTTKWYIENPLKISVVYTAKKLHWSKATVIKYDKILLNVLNTPL